MSNRKKLVLWIASFLGVWLFVGVFIAGLPWRSAFERRVAEIQARGEPVCAADLKPKPVPAEDNGGPLIEAIFRDIKEYQGYKNAPRLGLGGLGPEELRHLILDEPALKEIQSAVKDVFAELSPEERKARREAVATVKSAPAALTPAEKKKLDDAKEIRQQYRDLAMLLSEQPDLLDRLETALAKPHFHFSTEYRSPSWGILLPHLSFCRQSCNLLVDLSRYYQALGEPVLAQRCRLMLLRTPRMLNDESFLISSLVHVALTGIVCANLGEQISCLSDAELLEIKTAADKLEPWPKTWAQMMIAERIMAVEAIQLRGTNIEGVSLAFGNNEEWFWQIYYRTCLRYIDGLHFLRDYEIPIAGKPIPPSNELSYMGKMLLPALGNVQTKLQTEAAKIRQFRLGLALELYKRKNGTYPADLSGIPLPSQDHEGKPMKYEVFNEGRGACLEFEIKFLYKIAHFGLGERPEKHPCGEQNK
ncbi:MAG: hypothetical protein RL095_3151 [Verrucomicrobiota bacterium]|jgi:hypothetical protein